MPIDVSRLESMSTDGFLKLHLQDDGDVVVVVGKKNPRGILQLQAVEFCTPITGGGGSSKTWKALHELAKAMAQDNADPMQQGRAGMHKGDDLLL